ncbi:unnamed protein product, partial [Hapterophycus canaliculatus]
MPPVADTGISMFIPQPQAGSGLRMPAEQRWAPGNTSVVAIPVGIPPGSGATLSERDRRLEVRRDERRRRNSHGHQEGPAEKGFQEREKERQTFEREPAASKQVVLLGTHGSSSKEPGYPTVPPSFSNARAAIPVSAIGGGSLTSALDQRVAEKSDREAKYEQKRLQYIAAKRARSSDEQAVRFQEKHAQGAPTVAGRSPATVAAALLGKEHSIPTRPQGMECIPSPNTHPDGENTWMEGTHKSRLQPQESMPRSSPTAHSHPHFFEQGFVYSEEGTSLVAESAESNNDAERVKEQMVADTTNAQLEQRNERHTAISIPSTTAVEQVESYLQTQTVGKWGAGAVAPSAIDRKAEYARQLREQIAANETTRGATETENKSRSTITSSDTAINGGVVESSTRVAGSERVVGGSNNTDAKAKYAQQLREQMAAKENAQRAAKERMQHSPSSNAGPSWIEGATEGREAHRKRSNTEYAEQLRAQIAAQKDLHQAQQIRIASRSRPAIDGFLQVGYDNEYQQPQRWLGDAASFDVRRKRPELHQSGRDHGHEGLDRNTKEHSERMVDAGRTIPRAKGRTHNAAALDRQRRLDQQREYAEALRRDMATPKMDSLGRPIEDITSPSRARLRNARNQSRYSTNEGFHSDQENNFAIPCEGRELQLGPRYQVAGDTHQWSHQRQPSQLRESRGDHRSNAGAAWPSSHHRALYIEGQPQQSQRLPVSELHSEPHGESTNEQHHIGGGHNERRRPENERRNIRWVDHEGEAYGLPPPQGLYTSSGGGEQW